MHMMVIQSMAHSATQLPLIQQPHQYDKRQHTKLGQILYLDVVIHIQTILQEHLYKIIMLLQTQEH